MHATVLNLFSGFQQALRLLAFRQIHTILGMEPLPTSKAGSRNRKRRLDGSNAGEGEGEGKKDKKEEVDCLSATSAHFIKETGRMSQLKN